MSSLNIAVVGAGISGLSAAWLLSRKHRVTLFEGDDHLGGHANTTMVQTGAGPVPVDTGFIVYNAPNYPNLVALFDHLGVDTQDAEMSFALTLNNARLEYSGTGINGFFGQRRNVFRGAHWRLLGEINRFFNTARRNISLYADDITLGEFLKSESYSPALIEDHIVPMGAAIWSSNMAEMMRFPAKAFVTFYANHAMLQFLGRSRWRSVKGGSQNYVQKLMDDADLTAVVRKAATRVVRHAHGVHVEDTDGIVRIFDHVVMASHADQSLALIDDADPLERDALSSFSYQPNKAVLHSDPRLMPKRKHLWSCWNYIKTGAGADSELCVTYWMNALQQLDTTTNMFVTLNPTEEIDPELVHGVYQYDHPVFDYRAMQAQRRLWSLQGRRNTWFAGAYFGYGFHEDGLQSGLAVAEALGGVRRPWEVPNMNGRIAPHHSDAERHEFRAAE